jgi:hypothetical protein
LTVIYSISGIAVNHVDEWNPSYKIENKVVNISPKPDSGATNESMAEYVISELSLKDSLENLFRSGPVSIDLFFDNKTLNANLETGEVKMEIVNSRPVLRETNFLHLNAPKKLWTYVADAFAFGLIFLAVTGLFMLKGKNGITGRGKWLTIAGVLIPILFLILYM